MKIKVKELKRLLIESALIVFSVLFALFINRLAENQKTQQQKQIALERIVQEMQKNRVMIDSAENLHREVLVRRQQAAANERDSLRSTLARRGYFDREVLGILLGRRTFLPEIPKNTSWNAALTTGIIAEFDYEVVAALTEVYDFQKLMTEEILASVLEIFYAPVVEEEIKTINTLSVRLNELISLEQTTIDEIDEALATIYPSNPAPTATE